MKDANQSPEQYIVDLQQHWQETYGHVIESEHLRTALFLACAVREARLAATRGHALNALYRNVSPDMEGKSQIELLDIAKPSEVEYQRLVRHNIVADHAA